MNRQFLRTAPAFWQQPRFPAISGALISIIAAACLRGRLHADEIFQYLEPAHKLAFGTWTPAWEWDAGLRNWAVPGLIGGVFKVLSFLGFSSPWCLVGTVWCGCAIAQGFATKALFSLVEERDGREAAVVASWLHATWGGWVIYATRPLGDALSVAALIPAILFAWRSLHPKAAGDKLERPARKHLNSTLFPFLSGLLLGIAFVIRYPSAVFGAPIAGAYFLKKKWSSLASFAFGGIIVLACLGALDWATWGKPFHSAWRYFSFNILEGSSSAIFGEKPWWWNFPIFAGMAPIILIYHFLRGSMRRDLLAALFGTYWLVFSILKHKESRFLVPMIPLFIAIAAEPLIKDLKSLSKVLARMKPIQSKAWIAITGALYCSYSIAAATLMLPVGLNREVLDGTAALSHEPKVTGVVFAGLNLWNTGGSTYLRHQVPVKIISSLEISDDEAKPVHDPSVSHVVVRRNAMGAKQLATAGFVRWRQWNDLSVWVRR